MKKEKSAYLEKPWQDRAYNIYFFKQPAATPNVHFHSRFELIYILEGQLDAVINGKVIPCNEGDVIIVNAFEVHYYITKSENIQTYALTIDDLYLYDFNQIHGKKHFSSSCPSDGGKTNARVKDVILRWQEYGIDDLMANMGYFNLLLAELLKVCNLYEPNNLWSKSTDILQYIQEHYNENITMESVAEKWGYTREYFSRMFNKLVGVNFRSYLNKIRLEKAEILLKDKTRRVSDVVYDVGFANTVMYYRALKKFRKENLKD